MQRSRRIRNALIATAATGLVAAPVALAVPLDGAQRNPSNNASAGYNQETQIIGEIAQNQGGHASGTGGFVTRQSNKSDSGGGAIYGCRARAGTEACVAANNLANGDAFRFQAGESAATIGQLRFGLDINKAVDKPPFATNGTGLVKNLNADKVDGKSAEELVDKGSLLFAQVNADGAIPNSRGVPANGTANNVESSGHRVYTVPFTADVSKCAATANATDLPSQDRDTNPPMLLTSTTATANAVTVTEVGAGSAGYGFALQVTC
jgi:hypothetical protein